MQRQNRWHGNEITSTNTINLEKYLPRKEGWNKKAGISRTTFPYREPLRNSKEDNFIPNHSLKPKHTVIRATALSILQREVENIDLSCWQWISHCTVHNSDREHKNTFKKLEHFCVFIISVTWEYSYRQLSRYYEK